MNWLADLFKPFDFLTPLNEWLGSSKNAKIIPDSYYMKHRNVESDSIEFGKLSVPVILALGAAII